jgi:flagellin
MGMRINTNVASLNAQRSLAGTQRTIEKSYAQLSSGSRITKSADDAAGLAISENLKSQIRSYSQASRNANDGISLVQVAEGGLSEVSNILTRLRELGIQASSDTVGDRERGFINKEVQQLTKEIERISHTTRFGATSMLDASAGQYDIQVGINNDNFNDRISFDPSQLDARAATLGVDGLDFSEKASAQDSLATIDEALTKVAGYRADLGALQNRMQSTVDNLGVQHENLSAANSRIRDTDIAQATAESTRNSILLQASTATLAQANQVPQMALKLIG